MALERKSFNKDALEATFIQIGLQLQSPVVVYLLGGGAMCFRSQKLATKDLDLVFTSRKDHDNFAHTLNESGFKESGKLEKAYDDMKASSIWQDKEDFRFDLFTNSVCNALDFSEKMVARSSLLRVYGELTVQLVSNEDVILFKGITERDNDVDDIADIIRNSRRIDWEIVMAECVDQSKSRFYYGLLYNKFAELERKYGIIVPIAGQLLELDNKLIIREAFEILLKKGMSRTQAKANLMEKEFTDSEIEDAIKSA